MKKIYKYIIAIALIVLLLLAACHYYYSAETFSNDTSFGFIIMRHVNSEVTNKLWKKCITQIRQFYPDQKIVIIDDNSNYDFIDTDNVDLENCTIIDSEHKKRGELLPYYYFYKNKWFDRAIFIHDSVLINNKLNLDNIKDVKFLWHHDSTESPQPENVERLLSVLNHKEELITLYKDLTSWKGCFGTMSVIDYEFLKKITEKYNMTELVHHVEGRTDRCAVEQVFAIICINENPEILKENSVVGYYKDTINNRKSFSYSIDEYNEDVSNGAMTPSINKLFFARGAGS
jgi:hypothetical protein